MIVAGVDGCKKGWLMVKYSNNGYSSMAYHSLEALFNLNSDIDRLIIDIPIGLTSKSFDRTIETKLRKELEGKESSVFTPPCREALVFLPDKEKTKEQNIEITGKSLSEQSLGISKKIKEVDEFLQKTKLTNKVIESHPELCFKYLNDANVVLSKKKEDKGIKERLDIFKKHDNNLTSLYYQTLEKFPKKEVAKDDITDAICLCLVNQLAGKDNLEFLRDINTEDEKGIPVQLAYFNPSK